MNEDLEVGATAENEDHEVKSMDDTIRETLQKLGRPEFEEEAVEKEVEEKDVEENAKRPVGRPRKEDTEVVSEATDEIADAPVVSVPELPNTWKKEAADAWAKADPILRAEVERREADIHKGIEKYKAAADFANAVDTAIAPYRQTLQNLGIAPAAAIKELMAADHTLRYGKQHEKEMYLAQLAKAYGIDLGQATQTVQNIDPRLYTLEQQNRILQQQIEERKVQEQQQIETSLNSEISTFAADPKHEHFETVKMQMAALLQAGQAKDLSDAYEQAIYANPVTRQAVIQQQATAMKEEAAKKAQAAKAAAAVNLKSRPAMPIKEKIGSMEDTIRETYRRSMGLA